MNNENHKKWMLTVKYLSDIELSNTVSEHDLSGGFVLDVQDGPDGEIGLPGNIAKACGLSNGEEVEVTFKDRKMFFSKLPILNISE